MSLITQVATSSWPFTCRGTHFKCVSLAACWPCLFEDPGCMMARTATTPLHAYCIKDSISREKWTEATLILCPQQPQQGRHFLVLRRIKVPASIFSAASYCSRPRVLSSFFITTTLMSSASLHTNAALAPRVPTPVMRCEFDDGINMNTYPLCVLTYPPILRRSPPLALLGNYGKCYHTWQFFS